MLARSLDRHPDVVCGDEMFLFSTPLFYENYSHYKKWARAFYHFGLSANPFHQGRAFFRNSKAYGLKRSTLFKWSKEADDFSSFINRVRKHVTELTGKPIWAEKTPRNLRVIGKFINTFPDARIIHIVRDPRDVITSLSGRKKPLLQNIESWLGAVSAIQPYKDHNQVLQIRYEDLCQNPETTMQKVFEFLNISTDTNCIFNSENESQTIGKMKAHKSWGLTPDQQFSTKSIGRYKEQNIDWEAVMSFRLTAEYADILGTQQWSLGSLAKIYGYDVPTTVNTHKIDYRVDLGWKLSALRNFIDRKAGIPSYTPMIEGPSLSKPK